MPASFLATLKSAVSNSFPQLKESLRDSLDASGLFSPSRGDNDSGSDDSSDSDDDSEDN